MFNYYYSISSDFPSGFNQALLHQEILAETGITTVLSGILVESDDVTIIFETALSGAEESLLDVVVAAHPTETAPEGEAHPFSFNVVAGEDLLAHDLIYKDTVAAQVKKANAGDIEKSKVIGIMIAPLLTGEQGAAFFAGVDFVRFKTGLTLSNGDEVFLSTTDGLATNIIPAVSVGQIVRIGYVFDQANYAESQKALVAVDLDPIHLRRTVNDFNSFPVKVVPSESDIILIEDSSDSFSKKKVAISTLVGAVGGDTLDAVAGEALGLGDLIYKTTANDEVEKARATASPLSNVLGVVDATIPMGINGPVHTGGLQFVKFVGGLTLLPGDFVYLSTTAGMATNVAPTGVGEFVVDLGQVWNTSTYGGTTGDLAKIYLDIDLAVQVAAD